MPNDAPAPSPVPEGLEPAPAKRDANGFEVEDVAGRMLVLPVAELLGPADADPLLPQLTGVMADNMLAAADAVVDCVALVDGSVMVDEPLLEAKG